MRSLSPLAHDPVRLTRAAHGGVVGDQVRIGVVGDGGADRRHGSGGIDADIDFEEGVGLELNLPVHRDFGCRRESNLRVAEGTGQS